jgi:diadenosine tetraphosphate (Ap4A) HIT family hydrolase
MANPLVFETEFFTVYHETSFFIPGYLIIFPKKRTTNWGDFSEESLINLGPLLALSHTCVNSVINPERIYSAQYGEVERNIHLHIFPRDQETTTKYLSDCGLEPSSVIAGPALMDWVFNHKYLFTATQAEIDDIVYKISCEYKK